MKTLKQFSLNNDIIILMRLSARNLKTYIDLIKEKVLSKHIARPFFYSTNTIFFHVSGKGDKRFVLSLDDSEPRFYSAPNEIDVRGKDSKFIDQLNKEMNNAYIVDMEAVNGDKILKMSLTIINSVFKEEGRTLYFEMIPRHSNLVLTDLNDKVIVAYRPGELTDPRPLFKGMQYNYPPKLEFPEEDMNFSAQGYLDHCLSLEGQLTERRKKDRFGYILSALKSKEKSLRRKIESIAKDGEEAKTHLDDGRFGDAIYTCYSDIPANASSFEYEGEIIALDPAKSLAKNAELYYKKAKKAKQSIIMCEMYVEKSKKELADTISALEQIKYADEQGLETLEKELGLSGKKTPGSKKIKGVFEGLSLATIPYQIDYKGTRILFGKTSKQNDCLTFLFGTTKTHIWLHVMGDSGSHIVIKKDSPSNDEIRIAAEIALLNSNRVDGEVMYTLRKNVRKGNALGQAIVKEFDIIRINDISDEAIELLDHVTRADITK